MDQYKSEVRGQIREVSLPAGSEAGVCRASWGSAHSAMPRRALLGAICHPAGVRVARRSCQLTVTPVRDMTTVAAPGLAFSSSPGRWVVAVTVLGSGIAALDATVVNIAVPTIGRQFHVGVGGLQWVMSGYTLTLAAFLLIGGSLGDRFGRRRVYSIGIVWFALASAACGFAPGAVFLILARMLQGVDGSLLMPGSLAILEASFVPHRPRPGDRGLVGPGRSRHRGRAAAGRLPDLRRVLAVDLLHQRPHRGHGPRAGRPARP